MNSPQVLTVLDSQLGDQAASKITIVSFDWLVAGEEESQEVKLQRKERRLLTSPCFGQN